MSSDSEGNPSADRNLLFGILALQMDFIGRDQLVEAMGAWVLDNEGPTAIPVAGGLVGAMRRSFQPTTIF